MLTCRIFLSAVGITHAVLTPAWAQSPTPPLHLQWSYRCDGSVQTTPAIHGETIYLASMDGLVHAVDAASGQGKWRAELGGMTQAAPVVDATRNQLIVGCDDGWVYAFALADGTLRWKHRTPGDWTVIAGPQVKGQPAIKGDRLFVVNLLGHAEALNLADGVTIWKADGFGLVGGSPVLAGGKLLFTSTRRGIVCLDAGSGKLLWERKVGESFSTPTVADGVVYVGSCSGPSWSSKGVMSALQLVNGEPVWRQPLGGNGHFAGRVVGASILFRESLIFGDIEGRLFALDRKSGKQQWVLETELAIWAAGRQIGKVVWFASTSGRLMAVNVEGSGKIIDKLDLGAPLWTTPVAHGERLYQATDDGYLLCLSAARPQKKISRPPLQTALRFKHPAPSRPRLLHEFIGTASVFQSKPFSGPPKESDLRGKQLHFTFDLRVERGDNGPDGKPIAKGKQIQVVSRPLTNYFHWNCSPTFKGIDLDWKKNPRLRVVGSYEPPVLNPYADAKTQPRPLCAYIIQKEPRTESPTPPQHWPAWYVNNWVHFMCDIQEVDHERFFANTGYLNWGWDFVEERTMGRYLPRDVWAQVKPRYYLWRAVNSWRQIRDPRTRIRRGIPTTLTIYLSGAHHADPYYSERDLYAVAPKVTVRAEPSAGKAPLKVTFRSQVESKLPLNWTQWTFDSDKGLTADSLEQNPVHIYDKPGKYLVSVTAVTKSGTVGHAHIVVQVEP